MKLRLNFLIFLLILFPLSGAPEIREIYIEGEEFRLMGDYYRAIESYKTALQINPSYFGPLKGLAASYFGLGEYQEALYWIEEALRYDRDNLELINLQGRILLGLGNFKQAREYFSRVLEEEPYNIDAQFGMAELEIASGKMRNAIGRYRNALRISPENRRALLSLVLLHDELKDPGIAEEYIEQALYFYSDNPQVRYIAGAHYMFFKDYDTAMVHAEAALTLNSEYLDAGILYSQLSVKNGNYEEAAETLLRFIGDNRENPLLWYSLGTAYKKLEKIEESIQAFAMASSLRSGDDMARISLENLIINELEIDDPRRNKYAEYHFKLGIEYDGNNLINRAYEEFRRGLQISPRSREGRLLLGDIYNRNGYYSRYREELKIINEMDSENDVNISDELEFLEYRLESSVSSAWEVDQFYIDREKVKLALFYKESGMYHRESEEDLMNYFKSILSGFENIEVPEKPLKIETFSQAYRTARESKSDYFIIIDIEETDRVISLKNLFYMSETGGELKKWSIFRTGNQRIPEAVRKLAKDINTSIPVSGRLLDRSFDMGLVSLGNVDGLEVDDEFLIIRNGELLFSKEGFGFSYEDDAVLGTFNVTELDDFICQGTVEKRHFFDMINQGDHIIPAPEAIENQDDVETEDETDNEEVEEADMIDEPLPPDIYDSLLRIQ